MESNRACWYCSGLMTQTQEILFKQNKNLFYCEDGHFLEEVAQRGCGNVQNMMGHWPEQPTLTALAISRGLVLDLSRGASKPQLPGVQCYTLLSCTQAFVPSITEESDHKQIRKHVLHSQRLLGGMYQWHFPSSCSYTGKLHCSLPLAAWRRPGKIGRRCSTFPQELTLQISLLYKTPEFATLTDAAGLELYMISAPFPLPFSLTL